MRNRILLLLSLTACGKPAASAVPDDVADKAAAAPITVADAERQRMVDSVSAWVGMTMRQWEQGDSAALMDTYLPSGSLVSASDGELYTSRDSVASFLAGLSATTERKATYQTPRIDVVAPGVAAVTVSFRLEGRSAEKKPFHNHGVYSAVLAERDGHLRIIQEHQSTPSSRK